MATAVSNCLKPNGMNVFKAKTFLDSAGVALCGKNHAQRKFVRSGHTDCPACAKHSRQFLHFSSSTTLTGCPARVASAASCPYPRRSAKRSSRACGGGDHIAPAAAYFYAPKPRSAAFAGRVALGPSFGIRSSGLASNVPMSLGLGAAGEQNAPRNLASTRTTARRSQDLGWRAVAKQLSGLESESFSHRF